MAIAEMQVKAADAADTEKHLDAAESLLMENLDNKGGAGPADIQEKSLYQLAGLLYRRQKWAEAAIYLQDAVDQYPANEYALQAREKLAECYGRMADKYADLARTSLKVPDSFFIYTKQRSYYADRAMKTYEQLEDDIDTRLRAGGLSEAEQAVLQGILPRASFAAVDFEFDQGSYVEALRRSQKLAQRYADQVECLTAYQSIYRCAMVLPNKTAEAREALDKALSALNGPLKALPDDSFRSAVGTIMTRQEWEKWITERAKQLRSPTPERTH
jgi:tetratricopeptide (TPR) repeat protein